MANSSVVYTMPDKQIMVAPKKQGEELKRQLDTKAATAKATVAWRTATPSSSGYYAYYDALNTFLSNFTSETPDPYRTIQQIDSVAEKQKNLFSHLPQEEPIAYAELRVVCVIATLFADGVKQQLLRNSNIVVLPQNKASALEDSVDNLFLSRDLTARYLSDQNKVFYTTYEELREFSEQNAKTLRNSTTFADRHLADYVNNALALVHDWLQGLTTEDVMEQGVKDAASAKKNIVSAGGCLTDYPYSLNTKAQNLIDFIQATPPSLELVELYRKRSEEPHAPGSSHLKAVSVLLPPPTPIS